MSSYSRIKYNDINLDFSRGLTAFSPFPVQIKNTLFAKSGIAETLNFYRYWNFAFARSHASPDLKTQLMAFWDYVRTGASFSFWHDRDLAAYWPFEGKSLESIDEFSGTLTRATTAYYIDPTDGLIKSVATGTARFPTGKFGRGILFERAATNILVRSAELGNASWTATNITVSTDTVNTKDPAGTEIAESLLSTATDGTLRQDTSTNIGTTDAVFSVYLKNNTSGTESVTLYIIRADTGATLASQVVAVSGMWQRFSVIYDNPGTITANWGVVIEIDNSGKVIFAWGAQLEVGANVLVASTYIATTTVSVTRNIDVLAYTASNFFNNEATQGTICFWFSPAWGTATNNLTRNFFTLVGLNGNIELYMDTSELLKFDIAPKTNVTVNATSTAITMTANSFYHFAVTWDSTIADGLKIYFNGTQIGASTNSAFSITPTSTNFYLGSNGSSGSCDGVIDDFMIRRDVLSAAEIAEIARGNNALGYDRNYWAALMIEERQYTQNRLPGVPFWDIEIPVREVLS